MYFEKKKKGTGKEAYIEVAGLWTAWMPAWMLAHSPPQNRHSTFLSNWRFGFCLLINNSPSTILNHL